MNIVKNSNTLCVSFSDNTLAVFSKDLYQLDVLTELAKAGKETELLNIWNANKYLLEEFNDIEIIVNTLTTSDQSNRFIDLVNKLKEAGYEDITYMKPFLEKICNNIYINAIQEIFDYCCAHDFIITPEGNFLAYKNVNEDYTSIHASKDGTHLYHGIGTIVEELDFDTDRTNTCSKGLHFCSKDYLACYVGAKTIVVEINPEDVVAIPVDYNFAKGRCKKYKVIDEISYEETLNDFYTRIQLNSSDS